MNLIKNITSNIFKIVFSLILGGLILFWMYKDFDFKRIEHVMWHEMNWTWMLLSFPFGVLAQLFRGYRWRQTLEPLGEKPRMSTLCNAIFTSYAASLIVPRIGEFARCGVVKRYEGVSFTSALGTVVTERLIDSLLVMSITFVTIVLQVKVFGTFFNETGTNVDNILAHFSMIGYLITALCGVSVMVLGFFIIKRMAVYNKLKSTLFNIWKGITSLKSVKNKPLFLMLTLGIWASYFLHYYLTFFCFEATSGLGLWCALVTFVVGSIAVIVPTPNGAGPWHFAIKIMLMLYGVAEPDALYFVLIVHTVQTLLVVALGVYGWTALSLTSQKQNAVSKNENI